MPLASASSRGEGILRGCPSVDLREVGHHGTGRGRLLLSCVRSANRSNRMGRYPPLLMLEEDEIIPLLCLTREICACRPVSFLLTSDCPLVKWTRVIQALPKPQKGSTTEANRCRFLHYRKRGIRSSPFQSKNQGRRVRITATFLLSTEEHATQLATALCKRWGDVVGSLCPQMNVLPGRTIVAIWPRRSISQAPRISRRS